MARKTQSPGILVLGASGKLGRMLRAVWSAHPPLAQPVTWVARRPGADAVWRPSAPAGHLPQVSAILALWGVTPGEGRDLSDNTRLAVAAMDLGYALGADRVLHCSSAAVYPASDMPLSESVDGDPPSAYGRAKLDMERAVADWAHRNPGGPEACAMRIGNVAGAESLFSALDGAADITLDRFPDGQGPARSYIAPSDLAAVIGALVAADRDALPGVLNVSAPRATPMDAIADAAGRKVHWRAAPATALRSVTLDTGRLGAFCALPDTSADPHWLVGDATRWRAVR